MPASPAHTARPPYANAAPTFLHRHRAMARLPHGRTRALKAAALAFAMTGGWLYGAAPWVAVLWAHVFAFWRDALGLPARVVLTRYHGAFDLTLAIPHLDLSSGDPGLTLWLLTAAAALALFAVSFALPPRFTPAAYYLRAVIFIQATALAYFLLFPGAFPYTLDGYLKGMTATSFFVLSLVPLVLGFTYYLLDFSLPRKIALTLLTMGHLTIFIPLKYTLQACLLHYGSMLFMPVLYLIFGLLLDVLVFIALYGWGMSWRARRPHAGTTPGTMEHDVHTLYEARAHGSSEPGHRLRHPSRS